MRSNKWIVAVLLLGICAICLVGAYVVISKLLKSPAPHIECNCSNIHALVEEDDVHVGVPAWSPDGLWIAFTKAEVEHGDAAAGESKRNTSEVFIISPDGKESHKLTLDKLDDEEPTWSPDSKLLAFTTWSMSAYPPGHAIKIIEVPTGRLLSTFDCQFECFSPRWSPNGKWIAFEMKRGSNLPEYGQVDLWLLDIQTLTKSILLASAVNPRGLTWAPDSRKLYFVKDSGASTIIASVSSTGTDEKQDVFPVGYADSPAWYPAVNRVVYVSNASQDIYLKAANIPDAKAIPIVGPSTITNWTVADGVFAPALAPDGRRMAFIFGASAYGLYVIDLPPP